MTKKEFKIWLIQNDYTQSSLASALRISERTIIQYNQNGRYPWLFQLALKGLEK